QIALVVGAGWQGTGRASMLPRTYSFSSADGPPPVITGFSRDMSYTDGFCYVSAIAGATAIEISATQYFLGADPGEPASGAMSCYRWSDFTSATGHWLGFGGAGDSVAESQLWWTDAMCFLKEVDVLDHQSDEIEIFQDFIGSGTTGYAWFAYA